MDASTAVYMQQAMFQQNMAIAMMKSSANAQKSILNMIQDMVDVVSDRGQNLNITA
jgi:hypothetical protein